MCGPVSDIMFPASTIFFQGYDICLYREPQTPSTENPNPKNPKKDPKPP